MNAAEQVRTERGDGFAMSAWLVAAVLAASGCSDKTAAKDDAGSADAAVGDALTDSADSPDGLVGDVSQDVATTPDIVSKQVGLWTQIPLPGGSNADLHSVWSDGTTRVVAGGTNGAIVGYDGLQWSMLSHDHFATLNGVSGTAGAKTAFAVGMAGTVIQASGSGGAPGKNWGLPGGCLKSGECDDGDVCTNDVCDAGVCQHGASGVAGCCGGVTFGDSFDKGMGKWTVSDTYAAQGQGGIVWSSAAMTGSDGGPRATSAPKAAYFGRTDVPCIGQPGAFCGSFDNGKLVGSTMLSGDIKVPVAAKVELSFQLLADVGSSYDQMTVRVLPPSGIGDILWTRQSAVPTGSTDGKFVGQKLDLSKFSGQKIKLEIRFDSQTTSENAGEGLFLDDLALSTTCPAAGSSGKGITKSTLFGVWAAADDNAWAVGADGAVLHWDGGQWSMWGGGGPTSDLLGVGGTAGGQAFAVGTGSFVGQVSAAGIGKQNTPPGSQFAAVAVSAGAVSPSAVAVGAMGAVLELNGKDWTSAAAFTADDLTGVAAYGDGGYVAVSGGGVFERPAGGGWSQSFTPDGLLLAVTAVAPGSAIAVGSFGSMASQLKGVWTSQTWPFGPANLAAISAVSAQDIWVVGDDGYAGHYNGLNWEERLTGASTHLRGVWSPGAGDAFAVGLLGTILRWQGGAWAPMDGPPGIDWRSVWGRSATDVYAVGMGGKLAHWDGAVWTDLTPSQDKIDKTLRAVWGLNASDIWAVGDAGAIYHFTSGAWVQTVIEPFELPPDPEKPDEPPPKPYKVESTLLAVWGASKDDVWAFGLPDANGKGVVVHWDGTSWKYSQMFQDETRPVHAVWGWNKDHILLAGTQGMVLKFDGAQEFTELHPGTIATLFGITGYGKDALLVGDTGTILRYTPLDK